MPKGWRIVKRKHADRAFDGEGARRHGGRWNSPGTSLVYTAGSRSLAILEVLVHLESSGALAGYVLCAAGFAEAQVERLDRGRLPASWRAFPAPAELQRLGDEWVRGGTSPVLEVPSALVAQESNFLINPRHPEAATLEIEPPETFALDLRLLR